MTKFKIAYLFLFSIINITLSKKTIAQENQKIERCSSNKYLQEQLSKNKKFKQKIDSINYVIKQWIDENKYYIENRTITTIPVVVHVVYNKPEENIPDYQIDEQIDALNRDFRNQNADGENIPTIFQPLRADSKIEFCLAKRTPNNNSTTGIERRNTLETSFPVSLNSKVKYTDQGGLDAWNTNKYLNIWVCNLTDDNLGFTQLPGGEPQKDGVVIDYEYFGITGCSTPFNMGRTTVHEIGHFFNLIHIWGDENNCSGTDFCNDTPNQEKSTFFCPQFPVVENCSPNSPGIMFMNYLDYVDDNCMKMFTHDQVNRMQACLNTIRIGLKSSQGCTPVGIRNKNSISAKIFPNPASQKIEIEIPEIKSKSISIQIMNTYGTIVLKKTINNFKEKTSILLNNLANGVFFIKITSKKISCIKKIIILHNKNI